MNCCPVIQEDSCLVASQHQLAEFHSLWAKQKVKVNLGDKDALALCFRGNSMLAQDPSASEVCADDEEGWSLCDADLAGLSTEADVPAAQTAPFSKGTSGRVSSAALSSSHSQSKGVCRLESWLAGQTADTVKLQGSEIILSAAETLPEQQKKSASEQDSWWQRPLRAAMSTLAPPLQNMVGAAAQGMLTAAGFNQFLDQSLEPSSASGGVTAVPTPREHKAWTLVQEQPQRDEEPRFEEFFLDSASACSEALVNYFLEDMDPDSSEFGDGSRSASVDEWMKQAARQVAGATRSKQQRLLAWAAGSSEQQGTPLAAGGADVSWGCSSALKKPAAADSWRAAAAASGDGLSTTVAATRVAAAAESRAWELPAEKTAAYTPAPRVAYIPPGGTIPRISWGRPLEHSCRGGGFSGHVREQKLVQQSARQGSSSLVASLSAWC